MTDSPEVNLKSSDFAAPSADLGRLQQLALIVGVIGAAASIFGFVSQQEQFFQSYLVGWFFWFTVSVGCLGWLQINHLTAGGWGLMMRRAYEAGARTLVLMALLCIPFYFGMEALFSWARPEAIDDALIQTKVAYLNVPFFWLRVLVVFSILGALAFILSRLSWQQDETASSDDEKLRQAKITARLRNVSGPGLVITILMATVAGWDWLMSLDPHWFSSLYGLWTIASCGLIAMCLMAIFANWMSHRAPLQGEFQTKHFHDYGKLTLALVMIWAYFTLSQFLITWSGNVPEFVTWYYYRNTYGWKSFSIALVIIHFFLPFALLLSRPLKEKARTLSMVAAYLLVAKFLDYYWQAAPNFEKQLTIHWLDFATVIGVGGLWMWWFIGQYKKHPVFPVNEPYSADVLASHQH